MRILDALPDAVLLVRDLQITWASRRAGTLLGRTPESLVGVLLESLLTADDLRRLSNRLGAGREDPLWLRMRAAEATVTFDARVAAVPGEPPGSFVMALRPMPHDARLRRVLAGLGAALGSTDSEAVIGFEAAITSCEPIFRSLGWFGTLWEVDEDGAVLVHFMAPDASLTAQQRADELYGQLVPYEHVPLLAEVARTGQPCFFDDADEVSAAVWQRRGLSELDVRAVARSLSDRRLTRGIWAPIQPEAGVVTHVLTVVGSDMTDADFAAVMLLAHHLGAALRVAELAARLIAREGTAAMGGISAVIAHEAHQPVAELAELAESLYRDPPRASDVEPIVGTLDQQTTRLQRLVDHLAAFARPLGRPPERVDLADAIARALRLARASIRESRPAPAVELRITPPAPSVRADPALLGHALAHLVTNAFEHTRLGGRVRISAAPDGFGLVRISVHNDGARIPSAHLDRVFEPFFTTRPGRAGLGLAILRRVVEDMGGRVAVDPIESGAAFSVWLPVAEPSSVRSEEPAG
jgi:signal transduction histidine kinase